MTRGWRRDGYLISTDASMLDLEVVHVWDVRDGKIVRFRQFPDTVKFLEVVPAAVATTA